VRILAGDIGGTKTLLQLADVEPATACCTVRAERRFDSSAYPSLAPMAREFLAGEAAENVVSACFGVAGPVVDEGIRQHAGLTNLPWRLDSQELSSELAIPRVRLINDFQAIGYGIDGLQPSQLETVQERPRLAKGPRLVLGAGTGLGVAQMFRCAGHHEVYPTEAGHIAFAPCNDEQTELLGYLRREYGRVSCERLLSGAGIEAIYRFVTESGPADPSRRERVLSAPDPAAAISVGALDGTDPEAVKSLELFASIYGGVAGDLALVTLATGGVYLAGGIAPKILPFINSERFREAFNDKGRMAPLTLAMSVQVITEPKVGLLGAALAAARLAAGER
jgi:glucokinase